MTPHVVHELPVLVDGRGRMHSARVLGALDDDGSWKGSLEFFDEDGHTYETGTETHQPSLSDLIYWSTSLTHAYVARALVRAKASRPPGQPEPEKPVTRAPPPRRHARRSKPSTTRSRRA